MAVPVQTSSYAPPYFTMTIANSTAGTYTIDLSASQVNLEKGFSIQTNTITDSVITVLDSLDGSVFIDNTEDYLGTGITQAASDKVYKCNLKAPVKVVRIQCVLADATNAGIIKVLCPNR